MSKRRKSFNALKNCYDQTPKAELAKRREKIIEKCGISEKTFYRWINSPNSVPKLAKPVIAKVLNESEATLFPVTLKSI